MVCPSPTLGAQEQSSPGQEKQRPGRPDLLWLADLTGAHLGLAPIPQDPEDRCSVWENLVSLVDFQCPGFPLTSEELCDYIHVPCTPSSSSATPAVPVPVPQAVPWPPAPPGDIDYKTNPHVKPPYSYATLICMAMEASGKPKVTLAAICKWIRDNFCYFRRAHPSWQSSIRHNLCINKRFVKVPREKDEPGRGAFWKLHPQYSEWFKSSGTSEGRRALPEHIPAASGRRAQPGAWSVPSPVRSIPSPARSTSSPAQSISSSAQSISSPTGSIPSPAQSISSPAQSISSPTGSISSPTRSIPSPTRSPQSGLEVGAELQRLLQEFEEFENTHNWDAVGSQEGQLCPTAQPEGSWLPSDAQGSPEEEPAELTELMGSMDWEALLNPGPEQGDFCSLDPLQQIPCTQPAMSPQQLGWPQGHEQQILGEPGATKPGSDETLTAAAFLEAAWNEGTAENLCSSFPADPLCQGAENIQAPLSGMDVMDWDSLDLLSLF